MSTDQADVLMEPSLVDELLEAQRYVAYIASLIARRSLGQEVIVRRCPGCGHLFDIDQQWTQRYCGHRCQERAYRWRTNENASVKA